MSNPKHIVLAEWLLATAQTAIADTRRATSDTLDSREARAVYGMMLNDLQKLESRLTRYVEWLNRC